MRIAVLILTTLAIAGCQSTYYDVMERFGVHKRDILIDRVEEARQTQEEGQQQFREALEQFRLVVNFQGGELEDAYNRLNDEYEDSVAASEKISHRIDSVESVAEALFDEWESELDEYTSRSLRRESEKKLRDTRRRYDRLIETMRRAERSIDPVLAALKDNVLYLKHNLNARAIGSLKGELDSVNINVNALIKAMQKAIDESNAFIDELGG